MRVFVDHLSQEGGAHVLPVAPHLVGVAPLVPPAAGGVGAHGRGNGIEAVGQTESPKRLPEAPLRDGLHGVGSAERTVGKAALTGQTLQRAIELHGIEVVERLAEKAGTGDGAREGVFGHGIVPGRHGAGVTSAKTVHRLEQGFGH